MANFRMDATLEAQNNASSEIAALSAELGVLAAEFDRLDGRDVGVNVRADTLSAEEGIKDVERAAVRVGTLSPTVEVEADTAGAITGLTAVGAFADRLDGRDIDIDVKADTSVAITRLAAFTAAQGAATVASGAMSTATGVMNTAVSGTSAVTRGAASSIGGMAVRAGLLATALPAAATAVGLLAAAVGPAAAGLGIAGTAAATLAAGAGLVIFPLTRVASQMERLKEEGRALPPHLRQLDSALQGVRRATDRAFAGADKEAARFGAEILTLAKDYLPMLGQASERSVVGMRRSFREVREEVGGSAKDSLENILGRIPNLIRSGTKAVGRFGAGFLNFMEEAVPYAQDFLDSIAKSAKRFFEWSESKEGRREIREFLDSAVPVAKSLGNFLKDVGGALLKLGNEHGPTAAAAIDVITVAVEDLFYILDKTLDVLRAVVNHFQHMGELQREANNGRGFVLGQPGVVPVERAHGGDVAPTASAGIPGVPLYRAAHGLDLPAHYVEGPTRLAMPGLDVLYGEALSAGHREYMFRDGGNLRFITEEPGYDANSFNLWRDLGERKGYLGAPTPAQAGGVRAQARRRPSKQPLINRIQINEKVLAEVVTDLVRQNLDSGGIGEEWGL